MPTITATKEVDSTTFILRGNLQECLERNHIDSSTLSTFQIILLTINGTATDILEAYMFEQIRVFKLTAQLVSLVQNIPIMHLKEGTQVLIRKILLLRRISRKNFIYADSIIVPERLDKKFRNALLETKMFMGKIWFELRVETFKEIVDSNKEAADDLADYFNIQPSDNMFSRTYRIITNRNVVMMITEKFPESCFLKSF